MFKNCSQIDHKLFTNWSQIGYKLLTNLTQYDHLLVTLWTQIVNKLDTIWSQIGHKLITIWSQIGQNLDINWTQIGYKLDTAFICETDWTEISRKKRKYFSQKMQNDFSFSLQTLNPSHQPIYLYIWSSSILFFSSLSQKQRNKILKLTIFRTKNILSVSSVKNKNSIVIIFEKLIYINDNVIIFMCRKNNMQTI